MFSFWSNIIAFNKSIQYFFNEEKLKWGGIPFCVVSFQIFFVTLVQLMFGIVNLLSCFYSFRQECCKRFACFCFFVVLF